MAQPQPQAAQPETDSTPAEITFDPQIAPANGSVEPEEITQISPLELDMPTAVPANTHATAEAEGASLADFDFAAFLRSKDPAQKYIITDFARGRSWITVHARKELQHSTVLGQVIAHNFGTFPFHEDLLLTYEPAAQSETPAGEKQPHSPRDLERAALTLFTRPPFPGNTPANMFFRSLGKLPPYRKIVPPLEGQLYAVAKKTGVKIPEPLLYDEAGVLVTTYLGELCPLSTFFNYLLSKDTTNAVPPSREPAVRELLRSEDLAEALLKNAGKSLGRFLASIHDPETSRRIQSSLPEMPDDTPARSEYATTTILAEIELMRDRLKDWPGLFANSTELNDICEALTADLTQPLHRDE
ncbi:hypothetical protein HRR83_008005 [Exophiala dermatitidis]|uniref:Uncharacterized protein n=2 Tax=Exophiala dermatitidis TaxID=5970 RepID=H6BPF3_EXODN|nr:uncharacterized protein HMPREF1120_02581 [Exophiala dermatitidis NIH/UT8656]KAJ4502121.1 hypothetical protein HRR75_008598 [Exophiala dermatitidis]EHY54412.1 hypothetical protein HMPREF1120_02581 [Exophiala dermatitidis NIH/UT8656]KAJ4502688.1 hypothetical protein HRR73_009342 [Exophiala dermatitidis]KAJ4503226.1 hypothetical protein HRR74_009350 [Exophiala dermatitidis]KAJ4535792.1 hypothetical protein HRR77_007736 [Exophiala dermatitidis]